MELAGYVQCKVNLTSPTNAVIPLLKALLAFAPLTYLAQGVQV